MTIRVSTDYLDDMLVHALTNHPVHIYDSDGKKFPSAFIPFCEFGENSSISGQKRKYFEYPWTCNLFKARILKGQVCYEADLNLLKNKKTVEKDLKYGFSFLMDYNEDRQVTLLDQIPNKKSLVSEFSDIDGDDEAIIHLNTIGKLKAFFKFLFYCHKLYT